MSIILDGPTYEAFWRALISAFPSYSAMERFLRFRLDKRLAEITLGDSLNDVAFRVLQASQAEGWTIELLREARKSNPGNPLLHEVGERFGFALAGASELQREVIASVGTPFIDPAEWREKLGKLEHKVCMIEFPGYSATGFLVSPDCVMTNFHVIEKFREGGASSDEFSCIFDYKVGGAGRQVLVGETCGLARDWLVAASSHTAGGDCRDELDIAAIRLERPIGSHRIGGAQASEGAARGWVTAPHALTGVEPNSPLLILQHPRGQPLKACFASESIVSINSTGTTMYHRTNTEPGSSGSPCFNASLDLVAVHHSGDAAGFSGPINLATPVTAVREMLNRMRIMGIL